MFRADVDLGSVDPWDWDKFSEIIYPLRPLTESQQKDSILNWDKVVSLLKNPLQTKFTNVRL